MATWLVTLFSSLRAGLLCLCVLLLQCSQDDSPKDIVRVGFNSWPGYEPIYLAKVKGFFESQGLNLKLIELSSAGDVRRAFERNQIDIMASTLVELAIAAENTRSHPKIIAITDTSNGADAIYGSGNIRSMQDLKGRKIGLEGATVDVLVVIEALKYHGMTLEDVITVSGPQDDLIVEMEYGNMDAIKTYPPHSIKLLSKPGFHKIFDTSVIPDAIVDIISVNEQFAKEHADLVKKFLRGYYKALDFRDANPNDANAIMAAREQLSQEEFQDACKEIILKSREDQRPFLNDPLVAKRFQEDISALREANWLHTEIDAKEFFDHSLIE